jgi:hypothetical protein
VTTTYISDICWSTPRPYPNKRRNYVHLTVSCLLAHQLPSRSPVSHSSFSGKSQRSSSSRHGHRGSNRPAVCAGIPLLTQSQSGRSSSGRRPFHGPVLALAAAAAAAAASASPSPSSADVVRRNVLVACVRWSPVVDNSVCAGDCFCVCCQPRIAPPPPPPLLLTPLLDDRLRVELYPADEVSTPYPSIVLGMPADSHRLAMTWWPRPSFRDAAQPTHVGDTSVRQPSATTHTPSCRPLASSLSD